MTPATIRMRPTPATIGPTTAQVRTPLITLPSSTFRPCRVHTAPSTSASRPRVIHSQPFIARPAARGSPLVMDLRADELVVAGLDRLVGGLGQRWESGR